MGADEGEGLTLAGAVRRSHPAPADQPHEEQHDGNDQQYVDKVSESVATDHPQQPEDDEDDRDRFEHVSSP